MGRLRLAALAAVALVAVPARPPPPPGLVFYSSASDAVVDAGGMVLARGRGAAPAPSGRFARPCGSGICLDTDRRLSLPAVPRLLAWSPDETHLAFVMATDGHEAIWVVGTDGEGLRNLCGTWCPLLRYLDLTWEPSGTGLTFAATTPGGGGHRPDIYRMGLDGTGFRALTTDPGVDRSPAWSPDGTRLAFVSNRNGNDDVYVLDVTTDGLVRRLATAGVDDALTWSPDGRLLAFSTRRDGRWAVAVADRAGNVRIVATGAGDLLDPAWVRAAPAAG